MKILFYGPIAKSGKPAGGGFEAANRKNIDELRRNGVDVVEYANPIIMRQFGSIAKIAYIKLLFLPFCIFKYVGRKDVVVHTTPLYNHLLWPSVLVVWAAKVARLPLLLDIRAGSLINLSKTKSKLWMYGVRYMLRHAAKITVEGKSYIEEIPKVFGIDKEILYFPNITYCDNLKYQYRKEDYVNMIYFGRITKHKGVDLLIRMMPQLNDHYRLYLAGTISEDMHAKELQVKNVYYLGPLSPTGLNAVLQKMHIFLFPTKWAGEGQSNSLIESMQSGLIPISFDQGFCRDVIGDCGVILPQGSTEEDLRDAVLKVAESNMEVQGVKAMKHIEEYHNIERWIPWLTELYREILR